MKIKQEISFQNLYTHQIWIGEIPRFPKHILLLFKVPKLGYKWWFKYLGNGDFFRHPLYIYATGEQGLKLPLCYHHWLLQEVPWESPPDVFFPQHQLNQYLSLEVWQKGVSQEVWRQVQRRLHHSCLQSYNFIFNQHSLRLTTKIKRISSESLLNIVFPQKSLHKQHPVLQAFSLMMLKLLKRSKAWLFLLPPSPQLLHPPNHLMATLSTPSCWPSRDCCPGSSTSWRRTWSQ